MRTRYGSHQACPNYTRLIGCGIVKTFFTVSIIAGIIIIVSALLIFNQTYTEALSICAEMYDKMIDLAIESENTREIFQKYKSYNCEDNISAWEQLAKREVVRDV